MAADIEAARQLLEQADFQDSIRQLDLILKQDENNLAALHLLGEVLLEAGEPAKAYEVLQRCAAMDPTGQRGGIEKYLWLGQLAGGHEGVAWFEKGMSGLREQLDQNPEDSLLKRKMVKALCSIIEIWMTDLCMEPEAEQSCEALITEAMMTDDGLPEAWSVLGSIRISQQRNDEAREALERSWRLFQASRDVGPEDIPSLIRLAQSMMEMEQYELVLDVTAGVHQLDDQVGDPYYLNGLAHQLLSEQATDRARARHLAGAREAWTVLLGLDRDDVDPDMYETVAELIKNIPEVSPEEFSDSEEDGPLDPDVQFDEDE
jgi:tetratricopeptide (TPR) repeat protein